MSKKITFAPYFVVTIGSQQIVMKESLFIKFSEFFKKIGASCDHGLQLPAIVNDNAIIIL